MGEKEYKTVSTAGVVNLVVGIIMIIFGIAAGVLTIVEGAKLLSMKHKITF